MSTALEIALFAAALAVVVLVAVLVPVILRMGRTLDNVDRATQEIQSDLRPLLHDTRKLVSDLDRLVVSSQEQVDDMVEVVQTVKSWSQRANHLVETVGTAVESPVMTLVRNLKAFQTGVSVFMDFFRNRNHSKTETLEDKNHVG